MAGNEAKSRRDGNDASRRHQRDQRHRLPNANRTSIVHQPRCRPLAPQNDSIFGAMFNSLQTWWLTLDRQWGAFIVADGPSGFSAGAVPPDLARVVNRQYLVQFLEGSARYMLAGEDFLGEDLEWADFTYAQRIARGFRCREVNSAS